MAAPMKIFELRRWVSLTTAMDAEWRNMAIMQSTSKQDVIRRALSEYFERHGSPLPTPTTKGGRKKAARL